MTSVENLRTRILELVEKHEPNKVNDVNALMKKWKGSEVELLETLCSKFKEPYQKI